MRVRAADLRDGPYVLMGWVIDHAVEGVVEAAVAENLERIDSMAFRAELIERVVRFLRR